MAKFSAGQTVWTVSFANVQDAQGQKTGSLAAGTRATVLDGPRSLPGKTGVFWKVQAGAVVGNVNESALVAVDPNISYQNRQMRARVKPHGTPHPIRATVDGQQTGLMVESSAFELAVEYGWVGNPARWHLRIQSSRFGNGWIEYSMGDDPEHDSLEVYSDGNIDGQAMDGRPFPDFEKPWPTAWPPQPETPQPPTPPPPVVDPPPTTPATGTPVGNGGYEGGTQTAPLGISGLMALGCSLLWWADAATPKIDRQDSPWSPPEVMVNSAGQLTADLLPLPEGTHCAHAFKGWAPTWLKYGHPKVHLKAGPVTLSAMVFLDPVAEYTTPKTYGADPITAEFRLGFGELEPKAFLDGSAIPYGHWRRVDFAYTVPVEGDYTPYWEYRGRHGMTHNGLFVDDVRLDAEVTPPTEPPPAEFDIEPELARIESAAASLVDAQNVFALIVATQIALIRQKVRNG